MSKVEKALDAAEARYNQLMSNSTYNNSAFMQGVVRAMYWKWVSTAIADFNDCMNYIP